MHYAFNPRLLRTLLGLLVVLTLAGESIAAPRSTLKEAMATAEADTKSDSEPTRTPVAKTSRTTLKDTHSSNPIKVPSAIWSKTKATASVTKKSAIKKAPTPAAAAHPPSNEELEQRSGAAKAPLSAKQKKLLVPKARARKKALIAAKAAEAEKEKKEEVQEGEEQVDAATGSSAPSADVKQRTNSKVSAKAAARDLSEEEASDEAQTAQSPQPSEQKLKSSQSDETSAKAARSHSAITKSTPERDRTRGSTHERSAEYSHEDEDEEEEEEEEEEALLRTDKEEKTEREAVHVKKEKGAEKEKEEEEEEEALLRTDKEEKKQREHVKKEKTTGKDKKEDPTPSQEETFVPTTGNSKKSKSPKIDTGRNDEDEKKGSKGSAKGDRADEGTDAKDGESDTEKADDKYQFKNPPESHIDEYVDDDDDDKTTVAKCDPTLGCEQDASLKIILAIGLIAAAIAVIYLFNRMHHLCLFKYMPESTATILLGISVGLLIRVNGYTLSQVQSDTHAHRLPARSLTESQKKSDTEKL